jgi:hypothetical protein
MLVATEPPECPRDWRLCATAAASQMPEPGAFCVHVVPAWFPAVSVRALMWTFEFGPADGSAPIPIRRLLVGVQVWRNVL